MGMQLFHQSYSQNIDSSEDAQSPVVIIPGLFGSTSNWRSFAKAMSERYPVIVIDQRNHGQSPHAGSHTYFDMAQDLLDFLDQHDLERVTLCGHSMGGKTAMTFSLLHPERVEKLAVLDIAPITYTHSHTPYIDELLKLDLTSLGSRSDADKALQETIPEQGIRLFLLQSLTGSRGNYRWRLNLEVLRQDMAKIIGFPDQKLADKESEVLTAIIYAKGSGYVTPQSFEKIQSYFPNAQFHGISNAGHWLHVDQPATVLQVLSEFV